MIYIWSIIGINTQCVNFTLHYSVLHFFFFIFFTLYGISIAASHNCSHLIVVQCRLSRVSSTLFTRIIHIKYERCNICSKWNFWPLADIYLCINIYFIARYASVWVILPHATSHIDTTGWPLGCVISISSNTRRHLYWKWGYHIIYIWMGIQGNVVFGANDHSKIQGE